EFKDAFFLASQCNWDKKELEVYDYMILKAFDEINAIRTAEKKAMQRGLERGMEKGLERGMEKGLEKGLEKGIKQRNIEIAKNLLDVLDDETISLKTGLTLEDVKSLRV
ncbi:MAG: hypothetical protein JXQ66_07315, partial [Campylobacterales bacterium]|nr:hypothetical protein [Campylobacterales bacterium]